MRLSLLKAAHAVVSSASYRKSGSSSEALPDAEEKVEMPGLANVRVGSRGCRGVVVNNRVDGRIEVVAEVAPHRPNGCVIAETQTHGVGEVVEIASIGRVVGGVGHGNIAA